MQNFDQKVDDNYRAIEVDGHSFGVIREDPFGFYRIQYKGEHPLSPPLQGKFTTVERAVQEIGLWANNIRKEHEAREQAQEKIEVLETAIEEKEAEIVDAQAVAEAMKPKVTENGKRTTLKRNRS